MRFDIPEQKKLVHQMLMPIRWGDMDAMGHVNNTLYFRYMEIIRIDWLHGVGGPPDMNGEGFVIVNAVSNATDAAGRPSARGRLCSNFTTRLPLPSNTRLSDFNPSTAVITSASLALMTGSRAVFWLQPATNAFSDSG